MGVKYTKVLTTLLAGICIFIATILKYAEENDYVMGGIRGIWTAVSHYIYFHNGFPPLGFLLEKMATHKA